MFTLEAGKKLVIYTPTRTIIMEFGFSVFVRLPMLFFKSQGFECNPKVIVAEDINFLTE